MKDFKITTDKSKKDASINIAMEGHLNVSNIVSIKADFIKAIKGSKTININLKNVDDADVTIIQLLKSFEIKCVKEGLDFNLKMDLNHDIETLFNRAGLKKIF